MEKIKNSLRLYPSSSYFLLTLTQIYNSYTHTYNNTYLYLSIYRPFLSFPYIIHPAIISYLYCCFPFFFFSASSQKGPSFPLLDSLVLETFICNSEGAFTSRLPLWFCYFLSCDFHQH